MFKATTIPKRNKWVMAGAYISISYVLALRGNEGFMLDIKELLKNKGLKKNIVWLTLSGVVKGQKKVTLHQLRSVPVTNSGIDIEAWRNRLITVHEEAGRSEGPAICDDNGFLMTNNEMNNLFWTVLEELYLESPDDFPKDIFSIDHI